MSLQGFLAQIMFNQIIQGRYIKGVASLQHLAPFISILLRHKVANRYTKIVIHIKIDQWTLYMKDNNKNNIVWLIDSEKGVSC